MPDAREQAEAVARWCGWETEARTKPSFADPSKMIAAPPVWVHRELGIRQSLPDYAASLDAMREVEDEIKNRGLWEAYTWKLIGVVFGGEVALGGALEWWKIATATPAQRLAAAARVIEEVSQHGKD